MDAFSQPGQFNFLEVEIFVWLGFIVVLCVFCVLFVFFLSTTLLNLSVSCWVLILFWSPTQVARSKVYSEGISIYSCKYIDHVRLSASLDTKTTFLFLCNISQRINNTQESKCVPCNSVLDLMKVIKQ